MGVAIAASKSVKIKLYTYGVSTSERRGCHLTFKNVDCNSDTFLLGCLGILGINIANYDTLEGRLVVVCGPARVLSQPGFEMSSEEPCLF